MESVEDNVERLHEPPNEVLQIIFKFVLTLGWQQVYILRSVSKRWRENAEIVLAEAEKIEMKGSLKNGTFHDTKSFSGSLIRYLKLSPKCKEISLESMRINSQDISNILRMDQVCAVKFRRICVDAKSSKNMIINKRIHTLELSEMLITRLDLWSLFGKLPELKILKLKRPTLDQINYFGDLNISMKKFYNLMKLSNLTLDLDNNEKAGEILTILVRQFRDTLTYFSISITNLTGKHVNIISQLRNLETFDIRFIKKDHELTFLPRLFKLKTLYVCEWSPNGDYASAPIMYYLDHLYPQLKELKIELQSWNKQDNISGLGEHSFITLVRQGTAIENLHLKGFNINNKILRVISNIRGLKFLTLENVGGIEPLHVENYKPEGLELRIIQKYETSTIDGGLAKNQLI